MLFFLQERLDIYRRQDSYMCDVTGRHDLILCVTWLFCKRALFKCFFLRERLDIYRRQDSYICVTWQVDITYGYVRDAPCIHMCVAWLIYIYMCDTTHICVWHASNQCVWHDSYVHEWHDSYVSVRDVTNQGYSNVFLCDVTSHGSMRNLMRASSDVYIYICACEWHEAYIQICVTWLTCIYVWHNSYIYVCDINHVHICTCYMTCTFVWHDRYRLTGSLWSFSTKEPYHWWLFCEKWPAT